jgi:excisionase family DNA binding protein
MRKKILDIEDVARLKGVHTGTVYHWAEKGIIKSIKVGHNLFFSQGEVRGWQPPKRGRKPKEEGR